MKERNKYKIALNNLKRGYGILLGLLDKNVDKSVEKAFKILDELIEKEKPKKVEHSPEVDDDMVVCPICEKEFEIDYDEHCDYCPDCGQKLDWSEVEREMEVE